MAMTLTITDAGRAALINASNNGTAPVVIAQVGFTAATFTAAPENTVLPGEAKRVATISGDVIAADTIHLTVRDDGDDSYTVRGFALYLGDGTLFGLYGQPDVIVQKSVASVLMLVVDVRFVAIDATLISFGDANFLLPPATTERQGVVELATDAEANTGTDPARVVTAKSLKTVVMGWLDARLGANAPSAFVKGLLTSASAMLFRQAIGLGSAAVANTGAGNGLEADLLDGQHGAYYADIVGRLGYSPWGPNNDGAGSGLDAGLLAGQLPGYYTDIPGRLGYVPVNRNGDSMGGPLTVPTLSVTANGNGQAIKVGDDVWLGDVNQASTLSIRGQQDFNSGFLAFGNSGYQLGCYANDWTLRYGGQPVWHAGNDGDGSGLDAQFLDGWHRDSVRDWNNLLNKPGAFPPSGFGQNFGSTGHTIFPNGLIQQWVVVGAGAGFEGSIYAPFEFAFPNGIIHAMASTRLDAASNSADVFYQIAGAPSQFGATVYRQKTSGGSDNMGSSCIVLAWGW